MMFIFYPNIHSYITARMVYINKPREEKKDDIDSMMYIDWVWKFGTIMQWSIISCRSDPSCNPHGSADTHSASCTTPYPLPSTAQYTPPAAGPASPGRRTPHTASSPAWPPSTPSPNPRCAPCRSPSRRYACIAGSWPTRRIAGWRRTPHAGWKFWSCTYTTPKGCWRN